MAVAMYMASTCLGERITGCFGEMITGLLLCVGCLSPWEAIAVGGFAPPNPLQRISCTLSPTLVVLDGTQDEAFVHTTNEWWSYLALLLRAEGLGGYTATIQDYPDDLQCTELRLLA